jgi:hypothetical protein
MSSRRENLAYQIRLAMVVIKYRNSHIIDATLMHN